MRLVVLLALVATLVAAGQPERVPIHHVSPLLEHTHECMHDTPEIQNIQREMEKNVAPQAYMTGGNDFTIPPHGEPSAHRAAFHSMAIGSLRIKLSTADVDTPGRYCASATDVIPDYGGGTVACSAEAVLTATKRDFLVNKILPAAISRLSAALSVNQVQGNLKAPYTSVCAYHTVPAAHVTTGVAGADFVIYIASSPISSGAIAWATYCARDTTGRPVLGRMNFSPKFIDWSETNPNVNEVAIDTATHELLHALGFTYSLLSTLPGVVSSVTVRGGAPKKAIVTNNARGQYRTFIGCDRAIGPELEDEGGEGTQLSHWERRNMKDELMTGAGGSQLSAVTLGLLADTGYYYPNYGSAEGMLWGKQAGCPFIEDKCNTAASGMNKYWCDDTTGSRRYCTYDYRAYGGCYVTTTATTVLPSYFQYFSDPKIQGTRQFLDHCPAIDQYLNSNCDSLTHDVSSAEDFYGFTFGTTGRCFVTTDNFGKWAGGNAGGARCFMSRCPGGTRVQVKVRDTDWLNCPMDGSAGVINGPSGWVGTINCPKASDICTPALYYGAATPTPATPVPATPTPTTPKPATPMPATPTPTTPKPATPVPATPMPATPTPTTPKPATPVPATPVPATPKPPTTPVPSPFNPFTPASTPTPQPTTAPVSVPTPSPAPIGTPMPTVSGPGLTLSPGTPAPSTTQYVIAHSTGAAYTTALPPDGAQQPNGGPTSAPTAPPMLYSEVMSATFRIRGARWRRFSDDVSYAKLKDAIQADVARALGVTADTIMITKLALLDDFVYIEFIVKYPMLFAAVADDGSTTSPTTSRKSSVELQEAFNQVAITGSVDWLTSTVDLYQPVVNETLTVTDAATAIPPATDAPPTQPPTQPPTVAPTGAPPGAPLTTAVGVSPKKADVGRVDAAAAGPATMTALVVCATVLLGLTFVLN